MQDYTEVDLEFDVWKKWYLAGMEGESLRSNHKSEELEELWKEEVKRRRQERYFPLGELISQGKLRAKINWERLTEKLKRKELDMENKENKENQLNFNDLKLMPTDKLIEELFSRFEHAIFSARQEGYSLWMNRYLTQYKGDKMICVSLGHLIIEHIFEALKLETEHINKNFKIDE